MIPLSFLPRLRTLRRCLAVSMLALFIILLLATDYQYMEGKETSLFLELSPLTALGAFFTSDTFYKGLLLSLLVVISTLFLGRVFCSWICPLGILNQFLGWVFSHHRPAEAAALNTYQPVFRVKYYLLTALLVLAALGSLQVGLLDPIAFLTRSTTASLLPALDRLGIPVHAQPPVFWGGTLLTGLLLAVLLANRILPRFWCRVLCPLGALLGVLSRRAPFRIRRDVDRCNDCARCRRHCEGGCDPHTELRVSECHVCMNCIEDCPEGALRYGLPAPRDSVQQPLDVCRRRLVETVVAAAVGFPMLRSAAAPSNLPAAEVIRPPGALPEDEFLARCIKCDACVRVCPTNVLQPALLEAGLEGLWTPLLVNRIGYCEQFCVLCGRVCPTGAIRRISVAEKVGDAPFSHPIRIGTAFFDRGRCLPWSMNIPCTVVLHK
ncbi:ferredoxin-type protein NapH [Gammaproteobacteria bacterium]